MGDLYKAYYDVVRLCHKQGKLYSNKDYHSILSTETSALQRSKSTEDNIHEIFVIETAAAIPTDLIDTLYHCTGKQTADNENKSERHLFVRKKLKQRRRSKSFSEGVLRKSIHRSLFDLPSSEAMEEVTKATNCVIDDSGESPCEADVIKGSDVIINGHAEETDRVAKNVEEKQEVFDDEASESISSLADENNKGECQGNSQELKSKTRIISCQSDDSTSFEESRKFLSDSDLSHNSGNGNYKQPKSTSLEDISKLLNGEDCSSGLKQVQEEEGVVDPEISSICSTYRNKDSIISKLELELKESFRLLSERDLEVKAICADKVGDGWDKYAEKEEENSKLRRDMIELKAECSRLHDLYHKTVTLLEKAKTDVSALKVELEEREKYHEKTYFKMYEKGQKAALIEREQQLEELASENPKSVSTQELLDKLNHTQSELGRWQTLARQESYESANKPSTEPEATLQFMKDCMFHYLTDKDDCGLHLRAMVRMLRFTDKEKRKMIQIRRKVKKQSAEYFSGVLLNP